MTTYLIIDGYNLMHAAGIARQSYGRGDMERCRERLNRELVGLLSPEILQQAVIVYDAFTSVSDDNRQQIINGLMVLYAPKGTDADTEIERLLQQHSVPRRILVVSSDHRLHKSAGRRRARCVDSEDFWASLTSETDANSPPQRPEPMKPNLPPVPSEDRIDDLQRWADSTTAAEDTTEDIPQPAPQQPVPQQSVPPKPSVPLAAGKAPIDNLQRWADLAAAEAENEVSAPATPIAPTPPSAEKPDPMDDLQRWADSTAAAAEKEAEKAIMSNSIFDEDYLRQIDKEIEEDLLN